MVRRAEVLAVEYLLDLAVEAEQTMEYTKTYMPPPSPESTLLPEMVYKPLSEGRQPKPKSVLSPAMRRGVEPGAAGPEVASGPRENPKGDNHPEHGRGPEIPERRRRETSI